MIGISFYSPNVSGLTIYAKNLAEELVKRGHKVNVICAKQDSKLQSNELINGVNVHRCITPFIFGRGPIMPLFPIEVIKMIKNADIVDYNIPSFEVFVAAIIAKLLNKRIVLTHHCDLSNWKGLINQITEKVTYLSLLLSGYLADTIVVYTKDYANHSNYLTHFKDKLEYILPPVQVSKPTSKSKIKSKYKNVRYKIGFAGRIGREKGIDVLFNAIPFLTKSLGNNFKILLAGPSDEVVGGGDKEMLNELVKQYKDKIEFLGSLNQREIANFYSILDVLVLPSVENLESFGFVQVEAMKLGCPVVASNLPGVRMPTKLSGMGLVANVKDSSDLSKKIISVTKNRGKFVKNRKEVDTVFNFLDTINKYEKLFSRLS